MWLSLTSHRKLADWKVLVLQAASRPTYLAEIVRWEPTDLGFCDASGIGAGGVWLGPAGTVHNLVWRHPWPADVTAELASSTNPEGTITNLYLKLATLVLQEATLLEAVSKACMAARRSGSDNTSTVSWSTCESLMINLVVADLLHICALHSIFFFLNPSFFSTWANKTACLMMLHACFIYLPPNCSPMCLTCTPSRMVCGRSPSRCRNCFPA